MVCIEEEASSTLEVKHSKFIAHLVPYSSFEAKLEVLKKQHPKARHFVVAFRYLNEHEQVVEHSSDDGEPKGTSGKPALMVLQGKELINTAVIVVRYFGGVKLGTGGLVRAYSDAVNQVISVATLKPYEKRVTCKVAVEYEHTRQVEYELENLHISDVQKEFGQEVVYRLSTTQKQLDLFLEKLGRNIRVLEE